jgi:hypothetical protein
VDVPLKFKVGDEVVFQTPTRDYQKMFIGTRGQVVDITKDYIGTEFLLVLFDGFKYPINRRAKSFRHLTKLERALK